MLRRRLTFPAAAIALALSLGLTSLGFWAGRAIVSIMSDQLIRQMTGAVHRDVDIMMKTSDMTLSRAVNDIARHDIPLGDPVALAPELYGLLGDAPYVDWLFCGNEAGGAVDAGRLADGTRVFLMTDDFRAGLIREYEATPDGRMAGLLKSGVEFDTRQKTWYTRARDNHERYWTEPFLGSAEPILGMSLSMPVFDKDGAFAGVCGIDLILTQLSNFMQSLHLGDNGRAFIVDPAGLLIASSGGVAPVATGADGKELRLHGSEAGDPIVRATARHLGRHPEIVEPSSTIGLQVFSFDDAERGDIYAAVDRFEAPGGIAWTIVSALPASDFLGPVQRAAYFSIAIGTCIVAVSLALGLWTTGRALRPMVALTEAAQAIAKGEWRDVPETLRRDEIGVLAEAFSLMTIRLKSTLDGLRRSEESYRAIFENALEGIARTSLDGKILTANPALARIFGYASPEDMVADQQRQFYVRPHERDAMISELSSKGVVVGYEAEFFRKDGQPIWISFSSRMVRDATGEQAFIESFVTDITERKRAEASLQTVQAELARVSRVTTLGQLTASIAHEITQPIGSARNNARAALNFMDQQPPDLGEVREALGCVVGDADRAGDIIERIRDHIKKAPPRKQRFDLNEAINEVIVLARSAITENGVSVQTRLAEGLFPVRGDRVQLQQVVLNLILNTVEAMASVEAGPRELFISTEQDQTNGVLVTVHDSGPGIYPEHLEHVFEAFYSTKSTGVGMGLSICRSIIEAHGGKIWATANVPRGAVFHFTLPVGESVDYASSGSMAISSPN